MNQMVETETRFTTPVKSKLPPAMPGEAPMILANGISASPSSLRESRREKAPKTADSLFESFAWLYAFFRERLFRDDTARIIRTLWPAGTAIAGTRLIELGCGPGFYSCALAKRFPAIEVLGVDRSENQCAWAEKKSARMSLPNCRFASDNVLELSHAENSFDIVIAARLFTVLPDPQRAIAEMHRVLRPGGRCLIAEPRYAFWASLPLLAMWLLAAVTGAKSDYCEPRRAKVLSAAAFEKLFASQPWRHMKTWQEGRYQYALCEKV